MPRGTQFMHLRGHERAAFQPDPLERGCMTDDWRGGAGGQLPKVCTSASGHERPIEARPVAGPLYGLQRSKRPKGRVFRSCWAGL